MTNIGDNSGALTPEEERALFFNHFNKILRQDGIAKAARQQLGRLRKGAKADGIKLKNMDFALRCNELEDESIVVDEFKAMAQVMKWMGLPVNFQAEMFEDLAPLGERAYNAGALASATGKTAISPHSPGSKPDQAWLKGFNEDGSARVKALGEAMKKNVSANAKAKAGPARSEAEKALDGEPHFDDDTPAEPAKGGQKEGQPAKPKKVKAAAKKPARVKEPA